MMVIDLRVPPGGEFHIHISVGGEELKHVVHEGDIGIHSCFARTVQVKLEADVGFVGFAVDFGGSILAVSPLKEVVPGKLKAEGT